ncbi:MAG: type II toxin-antitoxin system VapC family toxin [Rubrivivax sp.]|nr:type II toxin-antitoxin system VapC family toxin [Rubrivivax sp.]
MATTRRIEPGPRPLHVAEPRAAYGRRPLAVVDASVIAAVLFAEPEQSAAARQLAQCQPAAPDLLPYELGNVAVNKLRRGHDESGVRASLADLEALGIALHPVCAAAAFDLAARHALTAYDAAYLCLAAELRAPLITFDRRLAEAALRHLGNLE